MTHPAIDEEAIDNIDIVRNANGGALKVATSAGVTDSADCTDNITRLNGDRKSIAEADIAILLDMAVLRVGGAAVRLLHSNSRRTIHIAAVLGVVTAPANVGARVLDSNNGLVKVPDALDDLRGKGRHAVAGG